MKTIKCKKCKKCKHEWISRVSKPKSCPNCKRYDWNKKKPTQSPSEPNKRHSVGVCSTGGMPTAQKWEDSE